MSDIKIFKVHKNNRKVGITCESFEELIKKCKIKFSLEENIIIKLEDGTEIDEEYFEVLENNEDLFIDMGNIISEQILSRLEKFLMQFNKLNHNDIHKNLEEVLNCKSIVGIFHALIALNDSKETICSHRYEDTNWFNGLNTRYKTKEDVLRNSAESRMRGYFQKLKKDLGGFEKTNSFHILKESIHEKLKHKKYNADYFDRSPIASNQRLCNSNGSFNCFGDFQSKCCAQSHVINPYRSREDRIVFSTWNFDHVIEKSRSIIPAVKEAIEESPDHLTIDCDYLFELLFEHRPPSGSKEYGNLKLVHIVCHNKNPHNLFLNRKRLIAQDTSKADIKKIKYS